MHIRPVLAALAACPLVVAACPAPEPTPLSYTDGCHPLLAGVQCNLPYPSDFFLVDDPTMPSGRRVEIPEAAKLVTEAGWSAEPTDFMPEDGFSPMSPVVVSFGVRIAQDSVAGIASDPVLTTEAGFATAVIDLATGERVPHFIDADPRARGDDRQALVVRPLQRLDELTTYGVFLSGLRTADGADAPTPEAFRRLRDGEVGADPVLAALVDDYEARVFPAAAAAGIDRKALQMAWTFTTGSDEHVWADMLRARELVLAALAQTAPVVAISDVQEGAILETALDEHPEITWRVIHGTITGPRVVDGDEAGATLLRDAEGKVMLDGTITFPFTAIVPASLRDRFAAGPALAFGHGFFGSRAEAEGYRARKLAHATGQVVFAIDWQGMSASDRGALSSALAEKVYTALQFGERLPQAMANWQTLTSAVVGGIVDDAVLEDGESAMRPFRRPSDGTGVVADPDNAAATNAGLPVVDHTQMGFIGISLGHYLGGVLNALNADLSRTVLHVGGAGFSHSMFRARPFQGFLVFLNISLPDSLDQQLLSAKMQRGFDRFDPATYAAFLLHQDLPRGPDNGRSQRRVLLQMGMGDAQVPNVASEFHARLIGLPQVNPTAHAPVFGLDQVDAPVAGSGFFAFDFGVDTSFYEKADFGPETPVHNGLRLTPEALAQIGAFLNEGVIMNPCDGPCSPLVVPED